MACCLCIKPIFSLPWLSHSRTKPPPILHTKMSATHKTNERKKIASLLPFPPLSLLPNNICQPLRFLKWKMDFIFMMWQIKKKKLLSSSPFHRRLCEVTGVTMVIRCCPPLPCLSPLKLSVCRPFSPIAFQQHDWGCFARYKIIIVSHINCNLDEHSRKYMMLKKLNSFILLEGIVHQKILSTTYVTFLFSAEHNYEDVQCSTSKQQ